MKPPRIRRPWTRGSQTSTSLSVWEAPPPDPWFFAGSAAVSNPTLSGASPPVLGPMPLPRPGPRHRFHAEPSTTASDRGAPTEPQTRQQQQQQRSEHQEEHQQHHDDQHGKHDEEHGHGDEHPHAHADDVLDIRRGRLWLRPVLAHDWGRSDKHRKVDWSELFSDLVVVAVALQMSSAIERDLTWATLATVGAMVRLGSHAWLGMRSCAECVLREREGERERKRGRESVCSCVCGCVRVCRCVRVCVRTFVYGMKTLVQNHACDVV